MPLTSRTFRIFVSSTFTDLKEVRNALQKYVFPRLRDLCIQNSCRFQAIANLYLDYIEVDQSYLQKQGFRKEYWS